MFIENENTPLILYTNIFPKEREKDLFDYLKTEINWGRDTYYINGKEVLSPRKTFFFGERKYEYSGQTKIPTPFSKPIRYLSNYIENFLNIEKDYFNGCLLNWYRDGNDSISYHSDNEEDMVKNGIIVVLSVGETREFLIKRNSTKEVLKYKLPSLSLGVMNPICQLLYEHSIPKEKNIKGDRISLTFRKFI